MSNLNTGKASPNVIVLPFYGTGAVFFLLLSLMMFFSADALQVHFFTPHTLALVHTAALGWGTMIIFGAAYQLLPVICERDLYSVPLAFSSFCLLLLGALFLIVSFWFFKVGLPMVSGGFFVLLATIFYSINVFKTINGKSIQMLFLISSAFWLLITVAIGLLLAINLANPFISQDHLEILKMHVHAGLAGWFLQLITGVSSKLIPMFLVGYSDKTNLLCKAFIFQNLGLTGFLLDHFYMGNSQRVYLYFILVSVGIICWVLYLRDTYLNRVKKRIDIHMRYTFTSFVSLGISLLLIPVLLSASGTQWVILYGIFVFLGWISALIMGKTFKTLPFIVWNSLYKEINGKIKIPLPKDLYNEKWLLYQSRCFLSGIIILPAGILINQLLIIKIGIFLWILVAILYILNITKILFHKKTANGYSA